MPRLAKAQPHTVRISENARRRLRDLSAHRGESMGAVLERAIERYYREELLAESNAAWESLMADSRTRQEIAAEQAPWDETIADGLKEPW